MREPAASPHLPSIQRPKEAAPAPVRLRSGAVSPSPDPRTPVLVGAGQITVHRSSGDPVTDRPEPVELMATALERAAEDCGGKGAGRRLLERSGSIRILPPLAWGYSNPGLLVSERLGIEPAETALASIGGNGPQSIANRSALAISEGKLDVVLVTGADCIGTRVAQIRDPDHPVLSWTTQPAGTAEPVKLDEDRDPVTAVEKGAGLDRPVRVYPLFANALRHAAGRTIEEESRFVAEFWSRFSTVAARNQYAWSSTESTAEEIMTTSPENRMIAFPYKMLEVANDRVDQGAGFIMCSLGTARDAGIPAERMVFLRSGSDANDHWYLTHRMDLHSSPAIRMAAGRALELAGTSADEIAHVDLYSCFPCAVQVGAAEIGLSLTDPSRPLTLTGGLGFAGGPGNNYGSHAIATLSGVLRSQGGTGLVTGLGWYQTKHSVGIWSSDPGEEPFRFESAQSEVDALPQRAPAADGADGTDGEIETYTVVFGRDATPELGIVAIITPEGARVWGTITDTDTLTTLTVEEGCGRRCRLRADGKVDVR
jgi:acetyl-CoA C-acetyltransferase